MGGAFLFTEIKSNLKNCISSGNSSIFEPLSTVGGVLSYKFKNSNYVLQYDSFKNDQKGKYYVIHEYEYILDDPDTGDGHTATKNWFNVDAATGSITPMFNGDGSLNKDF